MPLLHIFVLSVVQGITEFFPISSSAHLILVPAITGWADQGLMMDVAVHVGTLAAVMLYFWRDVARMVVGLWHFVTVRYSADRRLFLSVLVATLPLVVLGFVIAPYVDTLFRNVAIIAWTTLIFGIVLYLADRLGPVTYRVETMSYGHAILIGLAQVLSLVPGTSRSGITMIAGRALGFQRAEAARFSLLMSMPAILGAGLYEGQKLARGGDFSMGGDILIAMGLSFVAALLAIAFMMRWLRYFTFTPFVIYRIGLGLALLAWIYL